MKTIGIKVGVQIQDDLVDKLKQELLLFDKIGIVGLNLDRPIGIFEPVKDNFDIESAINFLRTLQNDGYIISLSLENLINDSKNLDFTPIMPELLKLLEQADKLVDVHHQAHRDYWARYYSFLKNFLNSTDEYNVPILSSMNFPLVKDSVKAEIINLLIEKFPMPDKTTPWENIVEFKSNPDNIGKFAGLKVWMNKAISSGSSISEINDELDYLLYQYSKSFELHKINYHSGTLQRIVVGGAELIENAARLKFSNIAKGLFSAHQEKVDLLKAELTAPGKEIAYIYQAQKTFR